MDLLEPAVCQENRRRLVPSPDSLRRGKRTKPHLSSHPKIQEICRLARTRDARVVIIRFFRLPLVWPLAALSENCVRFFDGRRPVGPNHGAERHMVTRDNGHATPSPCATTPRAPARAAWSRRARPAPRAASPRHLARCASCRVTAPRAAARVYRIAHHCFRRGGGHHRLTRERVHMASNY
jgi:hypothetical protein